MNAPIWYNVTHNYANSSRLKNRRCDLTITQRIVQVHRIVEKIAGVNAP